MKRQRQPRRLDLFDPAEPDRVYLTRWRLVDNRWFTVKLHRIARSDDPSRGVHDHPWSFVSVRLWGTYREHIESGSQRRVEDSRRVSLRRVGEFHRIELPSTAPCWTLVITGPRTNECWTFRQPRE